MRYPEVKISIIVPIYNAAQSLAKCIESIQAQTHSNLQIILIDDGSADHSLSICEKYARMDCRIEVCHTENKGSVAARKQGLKMAEGSYIGFVDADDYIEPGLFSEMLYAVTVSGADFVHTGYIEEGEGQDRAVNGFEETIIELEDASGRVEFLKRYILSETDSSRVTPSIWSKLFQRNFIQNCFKHLPEEQQYGEDLLCLWRCILESSRIALNKSTMYHYVVRKNSLSHVPYDAYMIREIGLWHHLVRLAEEYKCLEALKKDLHGFLKRRMVSVLLADEKSCIPIPHYFYKDMEQLVGKRILLYGAGDVGRDYYAQISRYQNCEIAAWADSCWRKFHFDYAEVIEGSKAVSVLCDVVLVAVKEGKTAMEIKEYLENMGVPKERIVWQEPGIYY